MAISANTSLNKAFDIDTFGALANAVKTRLTAVAASRIVGEQRLNSLLDAITLDRLVAHYKVAYNDTLPTTPVLTANGKINSTMDNITLAHVVKFLRDQGISVAVPVNTAAPVISGTGVGPFTANNGTWSNNPDTYTRQWYNGATAISGATSTTLAANNAYDGASITCRVTAHNEAGSSAAATSNAIVGQLPE